MKHRTLTHPFLTFWAVLAATAVAAPENAQHAEFFESSIRPLLANHCVECHGKQRAEAGLRLDTREDILAGGDYGKVVKLSDPLSSSLLLAVKHAGKTRGVKNMPEDAPKLPDQEIQALARWLELGMPWPQHDAAKARIAAKNDLRDHWSFKPLKVVDAPKTAPHPIDAFIQKELQAKQLEQAPEADRYTLIRRAYYSITGLPPTFEEVEKWKGRPLTELYDHLLASPHYGERWGRHWLDLARYSDVRGYEAGGRERRFIYSFTYRDWVIRALNADMPYDQFILYQLAAEQLVDDSDREHLAAMGFLTLAREGRSNLEIDDKIDTTFRGLMGLTVSCARCHDHKFDPIPTRDYYSLYGVFMNSEKPEENPLLGEPKDTPEYRQYLAGLAELEQDIEDFLKPRLDKLAEKFPNIANRPFQLEAKLDGASKRDLRNLRTKVDRYEANSPHAPARALILRDRSSPIPAHVFVRGNPGQRGDRVDRKFLSVIAGDEAPPFQKGSGRLEMAQQIADRNNPLTARVLVNRVWMHHFGKGLVTTPSDFGHQGEPPSHPELLDWLADWFMDNGWSLKKLHRLILTSDTWKQSSTHPLTAKQKLVDPENRLLWHFNRERLDFEAMRDSILAVNGSLNRQLYGRPVKVESPPYPFRRTVYAFINRQNLPPVFKTFDFANPQEHSPKRAYTTVPTQGLFALNHPFVLDHSRRLVQSAKLGELPSAEARIRALYKAVYARQPDPVELQISQRYIAAQAAEERGDPMAGKHQTSTAWQYGYGRYDTEKKTVEFTPFEVWTGDQWQPQETYPIENSELSYLALHEHGGHPGSWPHVASVVRWTAPYDLTISISSTLNKPSPKVDPVRGRIIRSGKNLIREAVCQPGKSVELNVKRLEVKRGETLDFQVDPHTNAAHDSYNWAPVITNLDQPGERWDYTEQFSGPGRPASVWERYAQALLTTNQFLFVD